MANELPTLNPAGPILLDAARHQMTLAEHARLEESAGAKIVERDGVFWRQVRPWFYRPLLLSQPLDERTLRPPCPWPGGYQHVVRDPARANSTMNFLAYDQLGDYDLEKVSHNRRRLIKNAAKCFQVRLVDSLPELVDQGHRAYLSFHQRTGYGYLTERRNKDQFAAWAGRLLGSSKAIVLGGYGPQGLTAVSVSYWIADTLVYATLFADTDALKQGVCEVMLHELRRAVGRHPAITHIVARNYQGGNSLDQYYLLRGAKLVRQPARFVVNAAAGFALRTFFPRAYAGLSGEH